MAVRREVVRLELDDQFTAGAARAAAATEVLKRELNGLNGSSVHLDKTARSASGLSREFDGAESSVSRFGKTTRESSADLNKFTGRLSLLATAGATLGPALLPIGAVAVPAITALAGGMGAAAGAAGVALLAFHGFGDALKALNAYQLEPTTAHLQKVQETMGALSPAAQDLVKRLDGLGPVFDRLRANAGASMFPGLNEGLDQILTLAPEVNDVISRLSAEMGKLANDAGAALKNDADWQAFFQFLRTDAAPTLDAFARATGNVIAGLGSMLVAFQPLSRSFSMGMLDMSRSFRDWAANLGDNAGFQHFVDYIRENGPAVRDFFVAVAQALGGLAHAAAPWGAAVLPILTDTAKVFATIADSPIGPTLYGAAAAMLVFNRASLVFGGAGLPKLAAGIGTTRTAVSGLTTELGIVATTWMTAGATTEREAARMAAARQRLLATGATSAGARAATGAVAVSAGGDLITKGYDKLGGNANTVGLSLMNGDKAWWKNPLAAGSTKIGGLIGLGGFNPDHIGDKGPVHAADAGLAQLVGSGRSTQAAQQLKKYADAANMSVKEAQKSFPLYTAAITEAARSTDSYGAATATAAGHMHAMALQSEEARKRLDAQRKAARQTGESFTAFGSNLNDSKVSLQSWIKSMADQAKALRDFTKNAQTAAKKGLRDGLIRELEAAGPAGAMRLKQLAGASQSEIGKANRAWAAGRAAIRAYVAMKVPPKKIDVNNNGAISAIEALQARINALHGKTITNVVQMVQAGFDSKRAGLNPSADGSTVPKTGLPYADRHLYLLADGEEVVSNRHGQADRNRALLKAINAGRLADGGTAGGHHRRTWRNDGVIDMRDFLHGISLSAASLKQLKAAVDRSQKAIDKETQKRDDLVSEKASYASEVSTSLAKADLFGNGLAGFNLAVAANTNDTNAGNQARARLKHKGLDGPLAQALYASGDLQTLQQFAALTPAQIAAEERRYGRMQRAESAFGRDAANQQYNAQIAKLDRTIAKYDRAHEKLTKALHNIEHRIHDGARTGTRQGMTDKARETHQRNRTGR